MNRKIAYSQITWAGQFLVSRKRILQTSVETYANLLEFFDVPKGQSARKDWIWQEGWWNNEPDNPTLGELASGRGHRPNTGLIQFPAIFRSRSGTVVADHIRLRRPVTRLELS